MYDQALQGKEEALRLKHTSTLAIVCNLGDLYRMQQKLAEAERTTRLALNGHEDTLGPKHTFTLKAINNLGRLLADQGKLVEAEPLYIRALQGYEALELVNVSSYTPALKTIFNLGELYSMTGQMEMAKGMYSRALSGYITVQEPFSKRCKELEDCLQVLHVASVESEACKIDLLGLERKSQGLLSGKLPQAGKAAECWIGYNGKVS